MSRECLTGGELRAVERRKTTVVQNLKFAGERIHTNHLTALDVVKNIYVPGVISTFIHYFNILIYLLFKHKLKHPYL